VGYFKRLSFHCGLAGGVVLGANDLAADVPVWLWCAWAVAWLSAELAGARTRRRARAQEAAAPDLERANLSLLASADTGADGSSRALLEADHRWRPSA
jgi:hypothetical protein